MPSSDADTLMFLEYNSRPIPAECQAVLDRKADTLVNDFVDGCFFAVDDFSTGLDLITGSEVSISYDAWRMRKREAQGSPVTFQVKPETLTFSRLIDASSPVVLELCLSSKPLDKAVLVKRHGVGAAGPLGFLRLEMLNVTICSVSWGDGEAVKESCSLAYQSLQMTYVPRRATGLAGQRKRASWGLASDASPAGS